MAAARQAGRLAGLAVSVGIGLAVATGGVGKPRPSRLIRLPAVPIRAATTGLKRADVSVRARDKVGSAMDRIARRAYMNNGWTGTDHLVAASELSTIPMEFFEAVDVSSIAVDPAAGWQTS